MESLSRAQLAQREGYLCHYCRRQMVLAPGYPNTVTRDHNVPRSRGGGSGANIVGACFRCNNLKGAMTGEEFRQLYDGRPFPRCLSEVLGENSAARILERRRRHAVERSRIRRLIEAELSGTLRR